MSDTEKNMGRALRKFHKGGFWHVVNRGVMKDNIFRSKDDYSFFLYRIIVMGTVPSLSLVCPQKYGKTNKRIL